MNDYKDFLGEIEEIAKIGSYEINLVTQKGWASDELKKIFGLDNHNEYSIEELKNIIHPENYEDVIQFFQESVKHKNYISYEYKGLNDKGETLYINTRCKIFRNEAGKPEKIIGINQDITERKKYEIELARYNTLNKEKNEVLNMVAHDLKSPINQILGFLNLLRIESAEKKEELISYIEDSCHTALSIIGEIIETAELENEGYKLKRKKTDLNNLTDESIKHFKLDARNKNIAITTQYADNVFVSVNQTKFSRAIDNMIANAIKFSPENSQIDIITQKTNDKVLLTIRDYGIGIDQDDIPLLFDKFKKPRKKGTRGEKSTGLGLSIVKKIVDLHEGAIYVESEIEKGSSFTIELPAADE